MQAHGLGKKPKNDDADEYGNKRQGPVKSVIVEDNYMLNQCDYLLAAVSTFCSWAAFWGNKPNLQFSIFNSPIIRD